MFRFERDELKRSTNRGFSHERAIRFQDVDAAGIIFYPRALELCHDLYVEFLADAGLPLHESLAGPLIAPIRHAEADYLRPLRFGDRVEVALVAARLGPTAPYTEVTFGFRVAKLPAREVAIVAQSVHTCVTRERFERAEVPAPLVRTLEARGLLAQESAP
ncbi:MAG TPA: thioesterase family protein [Polyangiaceae bacterium]|nr:thioesterase family protein [Polyangiaceae bacterium]